MHNDPMRRFTLLVQLIVVCVCLISPGTRARGDVLDSFDSADGWSLIVADGVKAEMHIVDGALRLDYDFTNGSGYCVVHRRVDLKLDPNYRFGFRLRGTGPRNTLEMKLVDPSGDNVWWSVRRNMALPAEWTPISVRRRHYSFAWGPSGGTPMTRVGAIEIAVSATQGGKGSVWLDDLVYERLPDVEPNPVEPRARRGDGVDLGRVQPDGSIHWTSDLSNELRLSFAQPVEFSAVELDWSDGSAPPHYRVEGSIDGERFTPIGEVSNSDGGVDMLFAPEHEAMVVRLVVDDQNAVLDGARFVPVEELANANAYFSMLSDRAAPGAYPPYFGALAPWTVIGLPRSNDEALVSAVGAIEPIKHGYSLEPFVVLDGRVRTWNDALVSQSLEDGSLPIPSVHWTLDRLKLDITALATDHLHAESVLARYTITNTSDRSQPLTLALAARPFQVLPAAQTLNTIGGVAPARSVEIAGGTIRVDGQVFTQALTNPAGALIADAPSGALVDRLANLTQRSKGKLISTGQFPSGALLFDMTLTPGETRSVVVALPMNGRGSESIQELPRINFDSVLETERSRWRGLLRRTEILVPDSASRLEQIIESNLGYILINADSPGIHPGSRSYERSWIRDGSMTSAALIALGHAQEARAFIEWYSQYQYSDGKIPCVVDARGPDPVDEHDAPGEFIFAVRNSAQAGGAFDENFARSIYPKVRAAVNYIETMRSKRLTEEFTGSIDPIKLACVGLMPESISHEGYSAKPMHSYWDDFWIYRGLGDAAELARLLGETGDEARYRALGDAFGKSLNASIRLASATHQIGYIPGCVELGDFDATSTSIAYYPTGAAEVLDAGLLKSTFERAWASTQQRITGDSWEAMTPYEVRTVATFVRLGWVDRAHTYLDWLIDRQDPKAWNQWGEIAYHDRTPCRFVGDMPHTWVGSGAILSILSMFAYEEHDTIMLGAGVPSAWLDDGHPIGVRSLVTRFGTLSYTLDKAGNTLTIEISPGCNPPDGFRINVRRLLFPNESLDANTQLVLVANGKRIKVDDDEVSMFTLEN